MFHPLLSKLATLGILTALGGAGAAAIAPHEMPALEPVGSAPTVVSVDADDVADGSSEAGVDANPAVHGKSAIAHARRDAKRAEVAARADARRAILRDGRPAPGEAPRGLTEAQREALREANGVPRAHREHRADPERCDRGHAEQGSKMRRGAARMNH